MKRVDMHSFERRDAASRAADRAHHHRLLGVLRQQQDDPVSALDSVRRSAVRIASFAAAGGEGTGAFIVPALRTAAQSIVALFDLAMRPGESMTATIDGRSYVLSVPGAHTYAGPGEWITGFMAACACREHALAERLAAVASEVRRLSSTSAQRDKFTYEEPAGMAAVARCDPTAGDRLARVLALAQPEHVHVCDEDGRLELVRGIELALRLHEGDPKRFNDALEALLVAHRAYWSANEKRRESPNGFLCLTALGLASIAHDRGIAIEVDSPYMPAWIVLGQLGDSWKNAAR
jgi:hypothetical protein